MVGSTTANTAKKASSSIGKMSSTSIKMSSSSSNMQSTINNGNSCTKKNLNLQSTANVDLQKDANFDLQSTTSATTVVNPRESTEIIAMFLGADFKWSDDKQPSPASSNHQPEHQRQLSDIIAGSPQKESSPIISEGSDELLNVSENLTLSDNLSELRVTIRRPPSSMTAASMRYGGLSEENTKRMWTPSQCSIDENLEQDEEEFLHQHALNQGEHPETFLQDHLFLSGGATPDSRTKMTPHTNNSRSRMTSISRQSRMTPIDKRMTPTSSTRRSSNFNFGRMSTPNFRSTPNFPRGYNVGDTTGNFDRYGPVNNSNMDIVLCTTRKPRSNTQSFIPSTNRKYRSGNPSMLGSQIVGNQSMNQSISGNHMVGNQWICTNCQCCMTCGGGSIHMQQAMNDMNPSSNTFMNTTMPMNVTMPLPNIPSIVANYDENFHYYACGHQKSNCGHHGPMGCAHQQQPCGHQGTLMDRYAPLIPREAGIPREKFLASYNDSMRRSYGRRKHSFGNVITDSNSIGKNSQDLEGLESILNDTFEEKSLGGSSLGRSSLSGKLSGGFSKGSLSREVRSLAMSVDSFGKDGFGRQGLPGDALDIRGAVLGLPLCDPANRALASSNAISKNSNHISIPGRQLSMTSNHISIAPSHQASQTSNYSNKLSIYPTIESGNSPPKNTVKRYHRLSRQVIENVYIPPESDGNVYLPRKEEVVYVPLNTSSSDMPMVSRKITKQLRKLPRTGLGDANPMALIKRAPGVIHTTINNSDSLDDDLYLSPGAPTNIGGSRVLPNQVVKQLTPMSIDISFPDSTNLSNTANRIGIDRSLSGDRISTRSVEPCGSGKKKRVLAGKRTRSTEAPDLFDDSEPEQTAVAVAEKKPRATCTDPDGNVLRKLNRTTSNIAHLVNGGDSSTNSSGEFREVALRKEQNASNVHMNQVGNASNHMNDVSHHAGRNDCPSNRTEGPTILSTHSTGSNSTESRTIVNSSWQTPTIVEENKRVFNSFSTNKKQRPRPSQALCSVNCTPHHRYIQRCIVQTPHTCVGGPRYSSSRTTTCSDIGVVSSSETLQSVSPATACGPTRSDIGLARSDILTSPLLLESPPLEEDEENLTITEYSPKGSVLSCNNTGATSHRSGAISQRSDVNGGTSNRSVLNVERMSHRSNATGNESLRSNCKENVSKNEDKNCIKGGATALNMSRGNIKSLHDTFDEALLNEELKKEFNSSVLLGNTPSMRDDDLISNSNLVSDSNLMSECGSYSSRQGSQIEAFHHTSRSGSLVESNRGLIGNKQIINSSVKIDHVANNADMGDASVIIGSNLQDTSIIDAVNIGDASVIIGADGADTQQPDGADTSVIDAVLDELQVGNVSLPDAKVEDARFPIMADVCHAHGVDRPVHDVSMIEMGDASVAPSVGEEVNRESSEDQDSFANQDSSKTQLEYSASTISNPINTDFVATSSTQENPSNTDFVVTGSTQKQIGTTQKSLDFVATAGSTASNKLANTVASLASNLACSEGSRGINEIPHVGTMSELLLSQESDGQIEKKSIVESDKHDVRKEESVSQEEPAKPGEEQQFNSLDGFLHPPGGFLRQMEGDLSIFRNSIRTTISSIHSDASYRTDRELNCNQNCRLRADSNANFRSRANSNSSHNVLMDSSQTPSIVMDTHTPVSSSTQNATPASSSTGHPVPNHNVFSTQNLISSSTLSSVQSLPSKQVLNPIVPTGICVSTTTSTVERPGSDATIIRPPSNVPRTPSKQEVMIKESMKPVFVDRDTQKFRPIRGEGVCQWKS